MSYIEKLLEGVEVEWKNLEEVAIIGTGSRNTNEAVENGAYPFYVRSQIPRTINEFEFDESAIITAGDGVGVGKVFHYVNGKYGLHQRAYRIVVKNEKILNSKFLYYYFVSNFYQYILRKSVHASVKSLRKPMFEKYKIPIPPLPVQKEIVRILDTFTELTTELTTELITRKQQYSFYREELLSFEKGDVEWKTLGEVGEFIRGVGLQKKNFTAAGVGCIHYGQIHTHYRTYADETITFVSEEFAEKARMAKTGDLIIATTSEDDKDVCKAVVWLGKDEIAISSDACFYRHNMNPKYISYFFQTHEFQKQKAPFITGAKVRRVNANNLAKFKIAIPSLKEQARIVSILDKFDTLANSISEGLPKEIELRQKQYEYYRDRLLTFPPLSEV